MQQDRPITAVEGPGEDDLLAELIQAERGAEQRLVEARAAAEQVLADAREEAEAITERARSEWRSRGEQAREDAHRRVVMRSRALISELRELIERLEGIDAEQIDAMARELLRDLFSSCSDVAPPEAPP